MVDSGETYGFDHPVSSHLKGPAPKCGGGSNNNLTAGSSKVSCRCSEDIARGEEGHCQQGHLGEGWCFVEYIKDPAKPKDVTLLKLKPFSSLFSM